MIKINSDPPEGYEGCWVRQEKVEAMESGGWASVPDACHQNLQFMVRSLQAEEPEPEPKPKSKSKSKSKADSEDSSQ